jgi:hypothetical protein
MVSEFVAELPEIGASQQFVGIDGPAGLSFEVISDVHQGLLDVPQGP